MLRSTAARMVSVPSGLLTCLLIFSALRTGCAMLMSRSEYGSLGESGRLPRLPVMRALMQRTVLVATVCHRILTGNLYQWRTPGFRASFSRGFTRGYGGALAGLLVLGLALS